MESPRADYADTAPLTPAAKPVVYQQPIDHGIQIPPPQSVTTEGIIIPTRMDWLAKLKAFRWYRTWYALRWKLASRVFSKPIPFLTAQLDVKVGDMLIMAPVTFGLLAWSAVLLIGLHTKDSGTPASIAMAVTFALTVRNNSLLLALTGLSYERAIFYHKLMAFLSLVTASMHGLSYLLKHHQVYGGGGAAGHVYTEDEYDDAKESAAVTGSIVYFPLVALFLFTFYVIRRRFFEFFLRMHWILFIAVVVGSLLHGAGLVAIGAALWAVDMLYRLVYQKRVYSQGAFFKSKTNKVNDDDVPPADKRLLGVVAPSQVTLHKVASDVISIRFPKIRADTGECFHYEAGQFAFLCVPGISWLEWHPFSISSAPHEPYVTFHIRALGDWTKRLLALASKTTTDDHIKSMALELLIDGPYGNVALDIANLERYSHFALFSGGIGVTPMKSVVNQLHYEFQQLNRVELQRVHFVWTLRDREMLHAQIKTGSFRDSLVSDMESNNESSAGYHLHHQDHVVSYFPDALQLAKSAATSHADSVFTAEVFLTQCERDVEHRHHLPGMESSMRYKSRPNVLEILHTIGRDAQMHKQKRVAVLVCGPSGMVSDVISASIQLAREMKLSFDVHSEKFEF